jgi:type I restriction enzyme S subunit
MPSEDWRQVKAGDVAAPERNALVGGPFGSNLVSRDYVDYGVPVIRGQNMGGRWISGEFVYVTPDKANSLSANLARPGDIIFTQRGALGQVALVPPNPFARYLISQSQMKLTANQAVADPLFLYYQFRSPEQQDYVRRNTIQTGVPHTNLGILRETPIILPPLFEQQAIAHILGTIDDKIELNRRMNETLEATARAIFKSWFVDFDPVRAKAAGEQPPGLAPHIADLFPDAFEASELGEIPEGWRDGTVGEGFNITMGQSPPGETYNEEGGGLPFYQGRRDFGFRYPSLRVYCTAPTRFAKPGDTLVSVRAPVGDTNMAVEDCCVGRGVAAVRHKTGSRSYTYYAMKSLSTLFYRFEAEGTVFGSINKRDLHNLPFLIPPTQVVAKFEHQVFPIDQRIEANEQQTQTLAALRDTLLPKLISGELRVPDAEKLVEAAL